MREARRGLRRLAIAPVLPAGADVAATGIAVDNLHVATRGGAEIVRGVSFNVAVGEVLGLVGESGSGKTTLALALLGYTAPGLEITGGSVRVGVETITGRTPRQLTRIRGRVVSYVPQDAGSALNPALTIGSQLREVRRAHARPSTPAWEDDDELRLLLERVKLDADDRMLRRYPHQLSGGQQQRVAIAMAFASRPQAVILDEPTTGLDVVTQQHLLDLIGEISADREVAIVYVSHDISVVERISSRIAVMYAGRMVEQGSQVEISRTPSHPYTEALLRCVPRITQPERPQGIPGSAPVPAPVGSKGCSFAPRCPLALDICRAEDPPAVELSAGHVAECHRTAVALPARPAVAARRMLSQDEPAEALIVNQLSAWHGNQQVLFDVNLELGAGRSVAIVGESGSGKTTFAKSIIGLHPKYSGEVRLAERVLAQSAQQRSSTDRRTIQYVFQNPYSSLNPRRTIAQILEQPARLFPEQHRTSRERVAEALERVHLSSNNLARYPRQLSGGERQRVAIARALIPKPAFLVCDEITASLDVSVQATIVDLLVSLTSEMGLGLIFITHQLPLVQAIATEAIVITHGRVNERGRTIDLLSHPTSTYTAQLVEAARAIYG